MKGMTQSKSAKTSLYANIRFRNVLVANVASSIGLGITMIAIPWLLVSSPDGDRFFGLITLGMTIFNFFSHITGYFKICIELYC